MNEAIILFTLSIYLSLSHCRKMNEVIILSSLSLSPYRKMKEVIILSSLSLPKEK